MRANSIPEVAEVVWPAGRMTFTYVGMTTAFVLLLEILTFMLLVFVVVNSQLHDDDASLAKRVAIQYAYAASLQANGSTLNPRSTFQPGMPGSLAPLGNSVGGNAHGNSFLENIFIPYVAERNPATPPIAIALLIAPHGHVVASSYPSRYPVDMPASTLLPQQAQLISHALQGVSTTAGGTSNTIYVAETVWSRNEKPIGVIYVQGTVPLIRLTDILPFALLLLPGALIFLVITAPIGGLFGLLTTQGLVRRIRQLVAATTGFASGDYTQRVSLTRKDGVGQLELHFNSMADQVVESIVRRQELAGQNAHLAERACISRELEVLALIARGLSNNEIATALIIGEGNVKMHVSNILSKLHLADRTQAAIYAFQKRLLPLNEALEKEE